MSHALFVIGIMPGWCVNWNHFLSRWSLDSCFVWYGYRKQALFGVRIRKHVFM